MKKDDVLQIRDEIIKAALPDIVFDGWHWETIERAAEKTGQSQATLRAVFPAGLMDVLDGFSDLADRQMLAALGDAPPEDMRIRDRIRTCVLTRFEVLAAHKEAVRASASFWALPSRKPRGAKMVWRSADKIWNWAGDDARDYNHYTKRGLLSGILVSTMLVWLDDESVDMSITKDFLDRRIENVLFVGQTLGRLNLGRFMKGLKKAS
ncbi:MAG: COQ9 family protein [Alphaproteobacteria bacterium]|nr:COQ9 family protein [Alphaproteobacteria bacterium]